MQNSPGLFIFMNKGRYIIMSFPYRYSIRKLLLSFLIFLCCITTVSAEPAWTLVNRGQHLLEQHRLSAAIELFQEALRLENNMPEALYGLGQAYLGSGDTQLALREFELALENSRFLHTPEKRYAILYAISDIHYIQANQRRLQDTLLSITDDDPYFNDPEHQESRRNYRRTLQQQGIDELFLLYRLPEIFSRRAHRELGIQFLLQNLPSQAVDHLIFAILMGFSDVIDEMIRVFPNYRYTSVLQTYEDIFTEDPRTQHIRDYLMGDSLTREILYLADAFYIEGQNALANNLWRLVSQLPGPEIIRARAQHQLRQPTMPETFIRRMIDSGIK